MNHYTEERKERKEKEKAKRATKERLPRRQARAFLPQQTPLIPALVNSHQVEHLIPRSPILDSLPCRRTSKLMIGPMIGIIMAMITIMGIVQPISPGAQMNGGQNGMITNHNMDTTDKDSGARADLLWLALLGHPARRSSSPRTATSCGGRYRHPPG